MPEATQARMLPLAGSARAPGIFLLAIMLAALLGMLAAVAAAWLPSGHGVRLPRAPLPIAPVLMAVVLVWTWRSFSRVGVRVDRDALIVDTGIVSKEIPLARLRGAGLRVVDLNERAELKPRWKKWGTSLPGFQSGWYHLRNGESAVCLLLDRQRVCYLRSEEDSLSVLLSLAEPEKLRALLER